MKPSERRAVTPSREGVRQAPLALRAKSDDAELPDDGWSIDGYGAVFNRFTVIDSYEGMFREKIAPGAMRRSFRESLPIMQFDHGRHPQIGSIPIADVKFAREEDDPDLAPEGGAHIGARLFQVMLFEPLRAAISAKAISGMSFRFSVVREKWEEADGTVIKDDRRLLEVLRETWSGDVPEDELPVRTLQELRVPEMGPVVWPAYRDTSVGVRSSIRTILERLDGDEELRIALAERLLTSPERGSDDESDDSTTDHDTDAQRGTSSEDGAAEHPSESDDAQRGTPSKDGAAKHPSKSTRQIVMTAKYESVLREMAKIKDTKGLSS